MPLYGETGRSARAGIAGDGIDRWRKKMDELDGYIFVTAEYNYGISGALKNALDHAYAEYNRKPASFIGYGGVGGARAVEQLRLIAVELQIAPLRNAVHIGMDAFIGVANQGKRLADYGYLTESATAMLDELSWWTRALSSAQAADTPPGEAAEPSAA